MKSKIALLDCNNFFVSCERLFRPDLLGRPVVVLSSNDGCVVARSQEVKDMGIPMGIPLFKVKKEFAAAKVVTFSSNFALYRDISARVMNTLRAEVSQMEQYSVDEAFFSVQADIDTDTYSKNLKTLIEQKVGIPVSIGIADSKTLAKVANAIAKKGNGTYTLDEADWTERSTDMHIGEIWGVGAGLSRKCTAHDLVTPAALVAADPARIAQLFGVVGTRLQSELSGVVAYPLGKARALQQSVMNTRSFAKETDDLTKLEKAIAYHVEHAVASVREMGALCSVVHVAVQPSRFGDYALQGISESVPLNSPSADTSVILKAALAAFRARYRPGVPYKKAGVVLSGIVTSEGITPDLFAANQSGEDEALWSTIDTLRERFGHDVVSLYGATDKAQLTSRQYNSGGQTTRWNDIPTVKAN